MYATRLRAVLLVLGLALALVAAGLFQLQIVEGARYRDEAQQRLRHDPGFYPTTRGAIYDRNGVVLAQDTGAFDVAIYYPFIELDDHFVARMARDWGFSTQEVQDRVARMWPALAKLTGEPEQELYRRAETIMDRVKIIQESINQSHGHPIVIPEATYGERNSRPHPIVYDVDLRTVGAISSRPEDFPGLVVIPTKRREYTQGAVAPHIIGRLNEVSREQLDPISGVNANRPPDDLKRYLPGDPIGSGGIEGACEERLRGSLGVFQKGVEGNFLEDIPPVPGQDVHLTLDIALQGDVEELLDHPPAGVGASHVEGAAVIIDCRTGEILALASSPRYDPRTFKADFPHLLDDPAKPMFNRAVDGQYPLGSVFKVITAAAGLHEGVFTPQTEFNCQGMLDPAHPNQFRCDIYVESHGMHGMIPFRTAVQKSCNIYFYHVAELLSRLPNGGYNLTAGAARLEQWALKFGLGQPTGIGMGRDPAGSLKEGDARNLAVGQGGLLVTPLQVAQLYGLVATDGHMPPLRLIQEHDPAGPAAPRDLGLNPRIMAVIRDALESVVEPGGTAYSTVYLPNIRIAGKTGTAQASRGEPHAWFAGYAPANNPRVAFAVIVEHGGHGGKTAGPIAREIVRKCADHGYLGDAPARPTLGARPGPTPQAPAGSLAPARPLG